MLLLAIDTAQGQSSLVLLSEGKIIHQFTDPDKAKQAENLILSIEHLLKEANLTYDDLTALAVNIGPGSFSGIRMGISAARGIALVKELPLIGVSGLEALALESKGEVLAIINAMRGQAYIQAFVDGVASSAPRLIDQDQLHTYITDTIEVRGYTGLPIMLSAALIAKVAGKKLESGQLTEALPLYIREPDAKPQY